MVDWNTVITSVLSSTIVASVISGIVAPRVNWGIEKARVQQAERRERIVKWREMVQAIAVARNNAQGCGSEGKDQSVASMLESNEHFYSLKPHLSQNTLVNIYSARTFLVGSTIDGALSLILDDISLLEKKWKLV